jgi:hypothetical protein
MTKNLIKEKILEKEVALGFSSRLRHHDYVGLDGLLHNRSMVCCGD